MSGNKVTYQTNFTGIKYNNNPLAVDANSFSNANNVYLNKYGALISRPPVNVVSYPWEAYGVDPIPVHLKIVGTYDLSNGGVLYIVYNATSARYNIRYKSPLGTYRAPLAFVNITSYRDFKLVQYKQYYILFTVDGTVMLDTNNPTNTWTLLSNNVDIPITAIQTGNEIVALDGNQLTASHKKQFVLKPDSDDTIYALPDNETAEVSFPSQTEVTYNVAKANEYTRERILRKLAIPTNDESTLVSMVGDKIAVAHADRVDISLDYGNSFETIVYPTVASIKYKNTASLSDDGLCFFYVHSDGVYRYELGTGVWTLIEVVVDYPYILDPYYTGMTIERELVGLPIYPEMIGANYGHFINAEKFAFMLTYQTLVSGQLKWIMVVYTKGLNMTNLFGNQLIDGFLVNYPNYLNSYAYKSTGAPILMIGNDNASWIANPYLNRKLVKIMDNDTVAFYSKRSATDAALILLKAAPTHLYQHYYDAGEATYASKLHYAAVTTKTWAFPTTFEINDILPSLNNKIRLLVKRGTTIFYWFTQQYTFVVTRNTAPDPDNYSISFYVDNIAAVAADTFDGTLSNSSIIHSLPGNKFLSDNSLLVYDDTLMLIATYTLPLAITITTKVVASGANYILYDEATNYWYTNIPILTTLIYTYLDNTAFTQVPVVTFDDQNLWLAMDKTLWIGHLVDDKLSVPPINNNVFSKTITAISPISATSKAIFFEDSIILCEQVSMSDGSIVWQYYPLKFSVGVRRNDTVVITNDGKFTIFPTKYGLAALTYQLDIAATEQAITYLTDDIKTMWSSFYNASDAIKIIHHNTQLILSNGTNQVLIYDLRTNGWYPLTFPPNVKVAEIHTNANNYEILELIPADTTITNMTAIYSMSKENDELYTYITPYRDTVLTGSLIITWHLTSQILLLDAPNHYKNISQLIIDQMDSNELKQSAYLTTQLFRQTGNVIKPSVELIYNIDTFAKITKKVNWWKVLGLKWQLNNDATSSYPTQLRLYNVSIKYDISYEVK